MNNTFMRQAKTAVFLHNNLIGGINNGEKKTMTGKEMIEEETRR